MHLLWGNRRKWESDITKQFYLFWQSAVFCIEIEANIGQNIATMLHYMQFVIKYEIAEFSHMKNFGIHNAGKPVNQSQ